MLMPPAPVAMETEPGEAVMAAHWCSQPLCLDVFFAPLSSASEPRVFSAPLAPIHQTPVCLLVSYPRFLSRRVRWESVFCSVLGGESLRLHPAHVRLPEAPEDGERLAAE